MMNVEGKGDGFKLHHSKFLVRHSIFISRSAETTPPAAGLKQSGRAGRRADRHM